MPNFTKLVRVGWSLLWLLALVALADEPRYVPNSQSSQVSVARSTPGYFQRHIAWHTLPPEAQQTVRLIQQGGPFPFMRDGTIFGNFEKRLPLKAHGYYTEYTVTTPGLTHRGARRIIAGAGSSGNPKNSDEYYYTADHYQTFQRILLPK